jgi:hypothetical protein
MPTSSRQLETSFDTSIRISSSAADSGVSKEIRVRPGLELRPGTIGSAVEKSVSSLASTLTPAMAASVFRKAASSNS